MIYKRAKREYNNKIQYNTAVSYTHLHANEVHLHRQSEPAVVEIYHRKHKLTFIYTGYDILLHLVSVKSGKLFQFLEIKHVCNGWSGVKGVNNCKIRLVNLMLNLKELLSLFFSEYEFPELVRRYIPCLLYTSGIYHRKHACSSEV